MKTKAERLKLIVKWAISFGESDIAPTLLRLMQELASKNKSLISFNSYQYLKFIHPVIDSINNPQREFYGERLRTILNIDLADPISVTVRNESTFRELTKSIIQREVPFYYINSWINTTRSNCEATFSFSTAGYEHDINEESSENQAAQSVSTKSSRIKKLQQFLGRLKNEDQKEMQPGTRQLSKEKTISVKWTLLFRASEHDFKNAAFHHYCDDKGPTITLVRAEDGQIFAGYAGVSWNSFGWTESNPKGFLAEISDSNLKRYDASSSASTSSTPYNPRYDASNTASAYSLPHKALYFSGSYNGATLTIMERNTYYRDYKSIFRAAKGSNNTT